MLLLEDCCVCVAARVVSSVCVLIEWFVGLVLQGGGISFYLLHGTWYYLLPGSILLLYVSGLQYVSLVNGRGGADSGTAEAVGSLLEQVGRAFNECSPLYTISTTP